MAQTAAAREFDLPGAGLGGTHLIEAGAGTGKTYTLAGIFLRLVVEERIPVNGILVVTYTEAATEELKQRIRESLRSALRAFSGVPAEDAFLAELVSRTPDAGAALRRLSDAVHDFDRAAVFTIHAFCRSVLAENAFETGSLFDTEMVTDLESLKQEIVDDFWRRHLYRASPLFVRFVLSRGITADRLLQKIGSYVSRPGPMRVIPAGPFPDTSEQEAAFLAAFDTVSTAWASEKEAVSHILLDHGDLNRRKYGRKKIPVWIAAMDRLADSEIPHPGLFPGFRKFTVKELASSMNRGAPAPAHPFFERCELLAQRQAELEQAFEQRLTALHTGLFHYMKQEMEARKREMNIQSFEDLLARVRRALEGPGGPALRKALRKKFRAALIDEFQDTDPVQYAIFRKIFDGGDRSLFLIGDPKQAIYGFRGADIFTYMQARRDVSRRHTLLRNWRSDPGLITAVNTLFSARHRPFLYEEIPYHPAVPGPPGEEKRPGEDDAATPPFRFWLADTRDLTPSAKPVPVETANRVIPAAVAEEIARLLSPGAPDRVGPGGRPLSAGDIAVLVPKNRQAQLIREALAARRIPAVLYNTGDLFDTREAMETERVLAAVSDPGDEQRVREALATDMMGLGGEDLDRLTGDEAAWEGTLDRFRVYHDLWRDHGFIRMFRHLLSRETVLVRLMGLTDGERRSTNTLHLMEVLHRTSVEKKLGVRELVKWLSDRRHSPSLRPEEHPLRLESDENAVKVVTIHKSKGLEYPVVFCPFSWQGPPVARKNEPFTFHDDARGEELTLDLGSPGRDRHLSLAKKERLAEDLRLLYVALTRAKYRCYLVWGRFNRGDASAPAYLLHPDVSQKAMENWREVTDDRVFRDLEALSRKAGGAIAVSGLPAGRAAPSGTPETPITRLERRTFSGRIDRRWCITSFSGLVSGVPGAEEPMDLDATLLSETPPANGPDEPPAETFSRDIFSFPRGAGAGVFFHDVLEHLDYSADAPDSVMELVKAKLDEYGFDRGWAKAVQGMLTRVLSVPLAREDGGPRLSSIGAEDRLNELEFHFPLKTLTPKRLGEIFRENTPSGLLEDFPEAVGRLHFSPARGFMRGFIDLVFRWRDRFYLVDWKSNHLGDRVEDYDAPALARVMKTEYYILQYTIYTLALDRYLRLRLPGYRYETHFGGVFYVFLRGVDPASGAHYGIYRDLPSPRLIETLGRELIGSPAA